MIKSNRHPIESSIGPDLTPLLDIIFIVMVFLMLTASVKLKSLDVQLPSSETAASKALEKQSLTINILNQAPYWAIDGQTYNNWETFQSGLLEKVSAAPDKDLVIAADKHAEIQHMVKLFGLLHENDIATTQILMEETN